MNNAIIGTAGHVDHGKTQLIKTLTGIDTDRLAEEKKRGITIELGFAYLTLPSGERAGIIDVPGHEKFIGNMLSGAFVIETVFAWPGLGRLGVMALFSRDFAVIQGVILVSTTIFVIVNLLVDILYIIVDPRIRIE